MRRADAFATRLLRSGRPGAMMIPSLRQQFNDEFTPEKYQAFLRRVDDVVRDACVVSAVGDALFLPEGADRSDGARMGRNLIRQLVDNPEYRAKSDVAVPAEFQGAE